MDLIELSFEGKDVRTISKEGETWWMLSDVAEILGYGHGPHAARIPKKDETHVHKVDTSSGPREGIFVNEPGLYRLIFSSRKQEAEEFKRWVFHEVLPQIRRTGRYID